jgi:hypothetical protein
MSKSKTSPAKKNTGKNRLMQIVVVIVLIVFAFYFILSSILNSSDGPVNKKLENALTDKTTYTFVKEGELAFTKPGGKAISEIDIEIADNNDQRAMD